MTRQKYYPSRISEQVVWLTNFADNVTACFTAVGMAAAAPAALADARYLVYVLGAWLSDVRAFNLAATQAVEIALTGLTAGSTFSMPVFTPPVMPTTPTPAVVPVAAGALNRLFKVIQQFKETNDYTETLGQTLGVIGPEDTADHPTPKFSLELEQGPACQCVNMPFTKYGHEGVYIESKRGTGGWEFLAIDTEKPYTDERPLLNPAQPEVREYRMRFWDKGTPNGPWSEVAKISVAP